MAPNAWLQALPYASAVAALVGQSFGIAQLKTYSGAGPWSKHLAAIAIEVLTIGMICALAADAASHAGVVRGAIVGGLSATAAYVVPRMFLNPVVTRLCSKCNAWGRTAIGLCVLIGLFMVMLAFNWIMTAA